MKKDLFKRELWIRIKKYRFENLVPPSFADKVAAVFGGTDAFTHAFAAKIARKHGWSNEFAFLAVREYKKFVYLGVTSHYEVTPPAIIDLVWHEHIHFTKGYREFCRGVLLRDFDHSPELIPYDEQTAVFNAQYEKTLAFYEHEFGVVPPREIWGETKFDSGRVSRSIQKPPRKNRDVTGGSSGDDVPLYLLFNSPSDAAYAPIPVDFVSSGGSFGGSGSSGGWSNASPSPSDSGSPTSSPSGCSSSSSCGGGGD